MFNINNIVEFYDVIKNVHNYMQGKEKTRSHEKIQKSTDVTVKSAVISIAIEQ